MTAERSTNWLAALEMRHLAERSFQEVRRSLQALSSLYVERRGRIASGAALEGAGKRAAFALYYGPIHFVLVREIVRSLGAASPAPARVLDLGCGTGVAGAAWAMEAGGRPIVEGVDRSAWANASCTASRAWSTSPSIPSASERKRRYPSRYASSIAATMSVSEALTSCIDSRGAENV